MKIHINAECTAITLIRTEGDPRPIRSTHTWGGGPIDPNSRLLHHLRLRLLELAASVTPSPAARLQADGHLAGDEHTQYLRLATRAAAGRPKHADLMIYDFHYAVRIAAEEFDDPKIGWVTLAIAATPAARDLLRAALPAACWQEGGC